MVSEWAYKPLSEIASHQKGYAFKSKDYQQEGCPVVRVSNFTTDSMMAQSFILCLKSSQTRISLLSY